MTQQIAPTLGIPSSEVKINLIGLVPGEKLHENLVDESEIDRLYKIDNMYVVLPRNKPDDKLEKAEIHHYSSRDVDSISKTEIEILVREYLELCKKRRDIWNDL